MGPSLLSSFILSWTHKLRLDELMERRRLIVTFSGELALLGRARDAPSPATGKKEKSEACVGGIRVLEPESVLFLEIMSLLPVLCLYAV